MEYDYQSIQHSFLWQRLREGGLILLVAIGVFLCIALATFHVADPGWLSSGMNAATITNAGGRVGAWCADVLFGLLGYFAYTIPLFIFYAVYRLYRDLRATFDPPLFILRIAGGLIALLSGSALLALFVAPAHSVLPQGAGGILGMLVGKGVMSAFNLTGATVLLITAFLIAMTLYSGISWIRLVLGFKAMIAYGVSALRDSLQLQMARLESFRAERLLKRQQAKQEKMAQKVAAKEKKNTAKISGGDKSQQGSRKTPLLPVLRKEKAINPPMIDNCSIESVHTESGQGDKNEKDELEQAHFDFAVRSELQSEMSTEPFTLSQSNSQQIDVTAKAKTETKVKAEIIEREPLDLPDLALLDEGNQDKKDLYSAAALEEMSRLVEGRLADFGVQAEVVDVCPGPVVTRYELELSPGIKASRVSNLAQDLARSLLARSVRVVEVIPGKSTIGVEIPNAKRELVRFREVLEADVFQQANSSLVLALGRDIAGEVVVADLARMPHLLVAGTTGSGKSVGMNAMVLSLLYRATPADVRMVMIDPKMLELSVYEGIPHLLTPVVTDMKEAASALRWCVGEMERRYRLLAALGVRNIKGYNDKVIAAQKAGAPLVNPLKIKAEGAEPELLAKLPFIVVFIDEFADMMMIVGKKVEELIARIAQKARAAGIHLVLATQRPSVDVVTGLIKANIPTRMAFQVSSKIDSRTIIDQAGAEQLLGHGDMLYLPPGSGVPTRVHGAFIDDHEVHAVVRQLKTQGVPDYIADLIDHGSGLDDYGQHAGEKNAEEQDELYDQAVEFIIDQQKVSASLIQRRFRIGYNRASRLVETMEAAGLVSDGQHGPREVLVSSQEGV
ncbi:DNA translocase FtsK [Piscirickettsia salmonis]|uniref:DNA translocase FtsK n=1 Tax=Piscirickettsia salmonis TaxID=1238 RepID=UPI0012BB0494|nr:DNA translocase FtsK [Piscirickettsia salmonis]QGP55293.1 DNA translocase FtsK [Piscirickettsia salmonis]QGP58850.1 DNA translocase FtsK [Piscirickettsia salmonis]QGP64859.1 DNA translocase FtsK [Piscirickettsia salmonis]